MLTIGFPAAAFDTNCYVLAPGRGEECLIIDPGIGVTDTIAEVLEEFGLRPAAVLLTHGHIDHIFSVTPVCGGTVAAYIHSDDRYRVADPIGGLDPAFRAMIQQQFGKLSWSEPEEVIEISDRQTLTLAGLDIEVIHAPGHTEGSVMFGLAQVPDTVSIPVGSTMVSGDVLFAGSIGRTDLPGGSMAAMERSLREVVLPLADDTLVLPGHGPATTIGRERISNPFLVDLG